MKNKLYNQKYLDFGYSHSYITKNYEDIILDSCLV